ncbi:transcriptional regulator [Paenibacillus polymyxa]|uniref:helix-turn-helix transcriptional regulator n=1 Tax=Paenibacillus polymyxa TaxID=1406 RepID=UPI001BECEDF6|nr:YafY family protein [Paenibacillus polymyxa]MBT2287274.1 transcriptional regulator [Paenibacillus polymyxa]
MSEKTSRLFQLINAIYAKPGITASELATKLEVSQRTIYRDISQISLFTTLMLEDEDKRNGGYRFLNENFLDPIRFNEEEELAFTLLPSLLERDKRPPGFDSAYDKVMTSHRKNQTQRSNLVRDITDMIQMGTPAYRTEYPNFLHEIIQAILDKRTIDTVYHTQSRDETSNRMIDPYYLIPREQRFYLIGFCHRAQGMRVFRLSRFQQVHITNEVFYLGDFNIQQYLKNTWSIHPGQRNTRFRVRFDSKVARYIREEELFVQPWMKELADGSLLFEVTVNNEHEFIMWLLQYGPDAEILEPQSAREEMKARMAAWMRMYQ